MKQRWHRHAEGFTLLEVMVALAIIAFAVVTYLHAQNMSVALLNDSTNVTVATLLATDRMVTLEGGEITGELDREGTFDDPQYVAFRWKERIVPSPFPNINIFEAHVEVSWDDNRGRRSVELLSLVVRR